MSADSLGLFGQAGQIFGLNPVLFWFIVLAVMLIMEMFSMGLTTIWFAGGALIAALCAALGLPFIVQLVLFLIVSLVLLFFTRPFALKYFNKSRERTNVEAMVGMQAIVIRDIDNIQETGRVTVDGKEWMARSVRSGDHIPVGSGVNIRSISGVKRIVEEIKDTQEV